MKAFYILLQWGELFQGSYTSKSEWWYSFCIADQDTARYSLCSAGWNCLSRAEHLKCITDNLFSSRVFLLNWCCIIIQEENGYMFGKDHKWRNNFILVKEQVQTRRDAIFAWEQKHKISVKFTSVLEFTLLKTHRTSLDN